MRGSVGVLAVLYRRSAILSEPMKSIALSVAVVFLPLLLLGCGGGNKVRVKAPFVDVQVDEDGTTRVKAPATDVEVQGD